MRSRRSFVSVFLCMCMCAVLLLAAGCWRADNSGGYAAEVDEPEYRRAKEFLKQGRNPEAMSEFNKVLAKRGLNNAPETHLDMAILYQQHMGEPLSAIYHYEKYLLLMPNAPRRDVVLQRIEAAKRDFASRLPGRPSLDLAGAPADYVETINRLRTQNEQLRAALLAAQAAAGLAPSNANPRAAGRPVAVANPVVVASPDSPFAQNTPSATQPVQTGAGGQPQNTPASPAAVSQPARQQPAQAQTQQPATRTQPQPQAPVRRHVVKQGDSLYGIARQYYGGSVTNAHIEAIVNANRDVLESRDTPLRPGMQLKMP